MFNQTIFNLINVLAADLGQGTQGANAVDPLYNAITVIGPYALSVVVALGLIYGVIVGVKYAKAEKAEDRAVLHKVLINGVIGFVAVIILLGILYAIRGPLVRWMNS